MKSLLTLLAFFFSTVLFSQTYTPFISQDSTEQWKDFQSCGVNGGGECAEKYRTIYHISGDTLLDGNQYAKVYALEQHSIEYSNFGIGNCTLSSTITSFFAGGIREAGKQVYFNNPGPELEYLMYDFNLGVGDTVPDPANWGFSANERIIDSLDSVLIDGTYRNRYNLPALANGPTRIIEGIGASTGFKQTIGVSLSCVMWLDCYLENEVVLYSEFGNCDLNLSAQELNADASVAIFPQPVRNGELFTIRSNEKHATISIYDSFGRFIYSDDFIDGEVAVIANWDAGLYFVRFGSSNILSMPFVIF